MLHDLAIRYAHKFLRFGLKTDTRSKKSQRRLEKIHRATEKALRAEIFAEVREATKSTVAGGPFKGMKIGTETSWGDGDLLPKLLGCYEEELTPVIESLKSVPFDVVVNIGSAEGFFAVGAAMTFNTTSVVAVDIDQAALDATMENARLNHVGHKVSTALGMTSEQLAGVAKEHDSCCVLCDCEGFEVKLFEDEIMGDLANCTCVIECHNFIGEDVVKVLKERFQPSHTVQVIEEGSRDPNRHQILRPRSNSMRWLSVSEGRPETMQWLIASPSSRN